MPLFSPFLVWTTCMYFKFKTNRYLYRICPQQKMSIIGKFRRNFITFEQTTQFMHVYFFYGIIDYGIFFSLLKTFSFEPQTNFLLANMSDYLYMNIFLGVFLPMIMEIPPTLNMNRQRHATDFFVRKPQFLEPRRPVEREEQHNRGEALCWAEESMRTNKLRREGEKVSPASALSTDLHRELERLNTNTTVIQILPHTTCEEEMSDVSTDEMDGPPPATRNLSGKLENRSKNFVTKNPAAKTKSKSIEVHSMSQIESNSRFRSTKSNFRSTKSNPIVPIDI